MLLKDACIMIKRSIIRLLTAYADAANNGEGCEDTHNIYQRRRTESNFC